MTHRLHRRIAVKVERAAERRASARSIVSSYRFDASLTRSAVTVCATGRGAQTFWAFASRTPRRATAEIGQPPMRELTSHALQKPRSVPPKRH